MGGKGGEGGVRVKQVGRNKARWILTWLGKRLIMGWGGELTSVWTM